MRRCHIDARKRDWPVKTPSTILQRPPSVFGVKTKDHRISPAGVFVSVASWARKVTTNCVGEGIEPTAYRLPATGGAGWALHQLFAFPARCQASAPQRFNWAVIIRTVSAASAAAIVCTSARRRSRIPNPQMRPELLRGSVSGPRKIVPGDNRPAIRRTMLGDLTGPPKKRAPQRNGGSVWEWRYHRTIPLRTHVCRYGEYESSEIRRSERLSSRLGRDGALSGNWVERHAAKLIMRRQSAGC
jgi:hypothetical protein